MSGIKITTNAASEATRLDRVARRIPDILDKALARWALLAHKSALANLSGPGLKKSNATGGAYPVPVRTGNLRRSESYITPGRTKAGVTARHGQAALFNSARYARDVHEGQSRHSHFGSRRFITDAIEDTRKEGFESTEFSRSLHRTWASSGGAA